MKKAKARAVPFDFALCAGCGHEVWLRNTSWVLDPDGWWHDRCYPQDRR